MADQSSLIKNELLKQLSDVPAEYNSYFAALSSGDVVEPPEVPPYNPEILTTAVASELSLQTGNIKDVDSARFNAAMRATKIAATLLKVNKNAQNYAIGWTQGGYRS